MASIKIDPAADAVYIKPAEIYTANRDVASPIRLRIATGGAGQSGLMRALSEAFILERVKIGDEHFSVAWLASDTSASFNYLASRSADMSITYHPVAESIAIRQGIASKKIYAWKDHWLLVGPKANPAQLSLDTKLSIYEHFIQLFQAAVDTAGSACPVRFLSRYDKSANNIKESEIWTAIGQTPWSHPYSTWYHKYVEFPFQALRAASELGEYTLTDRGTWLAIEGAVRERMMVFKSGGDDDGDVLLNPAHALVGVGVENLKMAEEFVAWLARADGGQEVIEMFEVNGRRLYTKAGNHYESGLTVLEDR